MMRAEQAVRWHGAEPIRGGGGPARASRLAARRARSARPTLTTSVRRRCPPSRPTDRHSRRSPARRSATSPRSSGRRRRTASAAPPTGSQRGCASEGLTARIEQERAHGTYWWPLGIPAAIAGLAASRRRPAPSGACRRARRSGDRRRRVGRQPLVPAPRAATANRPTTSSATPATRTPSRPSCSSPTTTPRTGRCCSRRRSRPSSATRFPGLLERSNTTPPVMFPVFGGPLLVALGGLTGLAPSAPRRRGGLARDGGDDGRDRFALDRPGRQRQPLRRRRPARPRAPARRAAARAACA